MARAAPPGRSDWRWDDIALSLRVIGPSEYAAQAALHALSYDALVVEGRHLGSGIDAVERIPAATDVVVIIEDGAELPTPVRAARRRAPDAGLVVVVSANAAGQARSLLAAGADALVLEAEAQDVLPAAVRSVALGQVSVPRQLRECVEHPALSHRELRIVALAATGYTNAEIAERLCVAESTVKAHLSSIFRRLGIKSRRQAATVVFASGDDFERGLLASLLATAPQNGRPD